MAKLQPTEQKVLSPQCRTKKAFLPALRTHTYTTLTEYEDVSHYTPLTHTYLSNQPIGALPVGPNFKFLVSSPGKRMDRHIHKRKNTDPFSPFPLPSKKKIGEERGKSKNFEITEERKNWGVSALLYYNQNYRHMSTSKNL